MRITQKAIAKKLGISLITVSRAINNNGYVSKKLRKQILEYVEKNNYIPHKASQVLVRNRIRRIVVFSSIFPHYFWNDIQKGIEIAADQIHAFNYHVVYQRLPECNSAEYIRVLRKEIDLGLDAVAIVNQRKYDMDLIVNTIESLNIPFITMNVDAPGSNRKCYIGSKYVAGGKLAGEFIGTSLQFKEKATVLVINLKEEISSFSDALDINSERLKGFLEVMQKRFPKVNCDIVFVSTKYQSELIDSQIYDLLVKREGAVDAVYFIPAFNTTFLKALEHLDYSKSITLLHDLDSSAMHHLETHLLTAVIYQNPILQGYYTIKTLEHLLESNTNPEMKNIEIVHNIILAENRNLFKNHHALTQLIE